MNEFLQSEIEDWKLEIPRFDWAGGSTTRPDPVVLGLQSTISNSQFTISNSRWLETFTVVWVLPTTISYRTGSNPPG